MSHNRKHLINPILPKDSSISCKNCPKEHMQKNVAADLTYQVKIDEEHHRECIEDIRDGLHQRFDHVFGGK